MLSLILDIVVLIFLGVTIFYCLQLSRAINNFSRHRQEMGKLLGDLSRGIDESLRAIDGLKNAGQQSGRDLQKIIREAAAAADELELINQSSASLAGRLEKLGQQNRVAVVETPEQRPKTTAPTQAAPPPAPEREFFIRDRDQGRDATNDTVDPDEAGSLQSQAEKDFLAALRKNKNNPGRKGF